MENQKKRPHHQEESVIKAIKDYLCKKYPKLDYSSTATQSMCPIEYLGGSISITYQSTCFNPDIIETCGGCTLGDGRDCSTPTHYQDIYSANCSCFQGETPKNIILKVYMGWNKDNSRDGCSNAYGDPNVFEEA